MHIQLATSLAQMQALKPHWQVLEKNTEASVFISFEWCWQQAQYQSQDNVFVLSAWHDEQCIAILPLTTTRLSRRVNTRVLTHLCQRFTDYQHLLCEDESQAGSVFDEMVDFLKAKKSPLRRLSWYLPYPSLAFKQLFGERGAIACQAWQHTLYRELGAPVKAKVAREARRRKRKLEQTGNIEINTNAVYDETLINWILDKSAQRHGANSLTSEKQRSSILALFSQYRSSLHLAYVKKDEAYLAAHLGFKHQQTLYYYVPVTTDEQRSLSPGIILLHEIIQHLPAMQLDTIDFLRGEESYKQDWGNTHHSHSAMLLKGHFGSNVKDRLFTELWLKRNAG